VTENQGKNLVTLRAKLGVSFCSIKAFTAQPHKILHSTIDITYILNPKSPSMLYQNILILPKDLVDWSSSKPHQFNTSK